jgi:spore maturation protein CgeB
MRLAFERTHGELRCFRPGVNHLRSKAAPPSGGIAIHVRLDSFAGSRSNLPGNPFGPAAMRILVLNADYENFLRVLYRENSGLSDASYAAQMTVRSDSLFAVANFYSRNFRAHGHAAEEVHVNNPFLQGAWAREHGLDITPPPLSLIDSGPSAAASLRRALAPLKPLLKPFLPLPPKMVLDGGMAAILRAQIKAYQPDVVLNQEMDFVRPGFFEALLPSGCLLVGQIGSELPQDEDFRSYDLIISSLPSFVRWFRERGVRAELNLLAFESRILEVMGPQPIRDIPVSFVGSLLSVHKERIALLEHVARHVPLAVWGNGVERLPLHSPLRAAHRGIAWGRQMYEIFYRSRISLNQHGFIALVEDTANNMRLYEATGMGSLLLTDAKSNLGSMFKVNSEVAAYSCPEDCVDQIRYYLANEKEHAAVAGAGQRRTLTDHNYFKRTGEILELIATCRAKAGTGLR